MPPRVWPPNGSSGARWASSVIGLCSREARRSRNGPPSEPMPSGRASARGQERADVRVRLPVSRDGPSGATSDRDPELEPGHQTRRPHDQQTAAPSPATPRAEPRDTRPPDARTPPRSRPTRLPRLIWILSRPPRESSPRLTRIPAYLICLARSPAAAPPPAHQRPPELARPVYVAGRGRGVRRKASDPPSSLSPGRKQGNTRRRGGGLLRSGEKHIERNTWRETQGGKHGVETGVPSVVGFSYSRRRL